jgi:hypothetical protein
MERELYSIDQARALLSGIARKTMLSRRSSIADELQTAQPDLRQFVRETIGAPLSEARFANYLPGFLADSSRANIVMERLKRFVS